MDSDSHDSFTLKDEPDSDSEIQNTINKRDQKMLWTTAKTLKLIAAMKTDCPELWDTSHPLNKDRLARTAKHDYLAQMFETTTEEICRKIHNLRTQFHNELRKIKRRRAAMGQLGCGEEASAVAAVAAAAGRGGWEYFDALSFLLPAPSGDPLDADDGVNIALAEFQANEEMEFSAAARAASIIPLPERAGKGRRSTSTPRVAASAPPPLPAHAHPMLWPEEPSPRIRPLSSVSTDECQIFGDFVASELRTLRSDESRKKLKRLIQKAILQVGEQEDVNIITDETT